MEEEEGSEINLQGVEFDVDMMDKGSSTPAGIKSNLIRKSPTPHKKNPLTGKSDPKPWSPPYKIVVTLSGYSQDINEEIANTLGKFDVEVKESLTKKTTVLVCKEFQS